MPFPARIAIATKNAHKLRELLRICRDWPVEWLTVETNSGPWPDVEEPHDTYLDNALEKARLVARSLGVPAVADDSGIEVDGLDGAPGPRSARYAGEGATDVENLEKLLVAIARFPSQHKTARYRCLAAIAWPDGSEMHAEAVCEGMLIADPRGTGGFGYDPAFVPEGEIRTMAELSDEEKDQISHRGRAFRALAGQLSDRPPREKRAGFGA
ncbi:MAG TPA: RdgB/HAM1 family non-canonical purine NTP pyrophosphatase [Actinomycetota bacterium]|nr:RdgB/HAM1 family non-canonical purine NTP pyrophosphatase [Actinomycetota bacterium]